MMQVYFFAILIALAEGSQNEFNGHRGGGGGGGGGGPIASPEYGVPPKGKSDVSYDDDAFYNDFELRRNKEEWTSFYECPFDFDDAAAVAANCAGESLYQYTDSDATCGPNEDLSIHDAMLEDFIQHNKLTPEHADHDHPVHDHPSDASCSFASLWYHDSNVGQQRWCCCKTNCGLSGKNKKKNVVDPLNLDLDEDGPLQEIHRTQGLEVSCLVSSIF